MSVMNFFWSASGLSRRNWGASLRISGMASCAKFKERYVVELENRKAMFLARVLGKRAERVERA